MRLLKPTRMAIFGLGFLAGSRAGRGAWNAVENKVSQLQNRGVGGLYGDNVRAVPNPEANSSTSRTLSEI